MSIKVPPPIDEPIKQLERGPLVQPGTEIHRSECHVHAPRLQPGAHSRSRLVEQIHVLTGRGRREDRLEPRHLRYYERIGLLDGIARTAGGRRSFSDGDIDWLGVLRCLRDTGMPIAGMQHYAELCRAGDGTLAQRIALLAEHDAAVEQQIRDLRAQQRHIRDKIAWYRSQA